MMQYKDLILPSEEWAKISRFNEVIKELSVQGCEEMCGQPDNGRRLSFLAVENGPEFVFSFIHEYFEDVPHDRLSLLSWPSAVECNVDTGVIVETRLMFLAKEHDTALLVGLFHTNGFVVRSFEYLDDDPQDRWEAEGFLRRTMHVLNAAVSNRVDHAAASKTPSSVSDFGADVLVLAALAIQGYTPEESICAIGGWTELGKQSFTRARPLAVEAGELLDDVIDGRAIGGCSFQKPPTRDSKGRFCSKAN